jgi:hypothetical protein
VTRRHLRLLTSFAAGSLGRGLTPDEQAACEAALVTARQRTGDGVLTLPAVVEALLWPDAAAASRPAADTEALAAAGRQVALELRRLCQGDLAGMFDGPTTPGLALNGPLVVLDLSALYGSPALGLLMLCATAWLQASLRAHADRRLIVVIDEAWAILRHLEIARWLQASWKLSRQYGVANIAVIHRLSDLRAAGAEGSEQAALAQGLLADSETRVIYGQSPAETAQASELLGLTDIEAEILPALEPRSDSYDPSRACSSTDTSRPSPSGSATRTAAAGRRVAVQPGPRGGQVSGSIADASGPSSAGQSRARRDRHGARDPRLPVTPEWLPRPGDPHRGFASSASAEAVGAHNCPSLRRAAPISATRRSPCSVRFATMASSASADERGSR